MNSFEDQALIRPYLHPGERILWCGRPDRGLVFRRSDLYVIPATLAWAGLGLVGILPSATPGLSGLVVVTPFILVAAWMLGGRYLHEAWLRRRIVYVLTNHRVLILRRGRRSQVNSHDLAYLPMLDLSEEARGRGSITFDLGEETSPWKNGIFADSGPSVFSGSHFCRIERPGTVYDLICRAVRSRRQEMLGEVPANRSFIG